MDTRCPNCRAELRGRYVGASTARCPTCKAELCLNTHPSELSLDSSVIEIKAIGIIVLVLIAFLVAGVSTAMLPVLLIGALGMYFVYVLIRWYNSVPNDWPRWALVSKHRITARDTKSN